MGQANTRGQTWLCLAVGAVAFALACAPVDEAEWQTLPTGPSSPAPLQFAAAVTSAQTPPTDTPLEQTPEEPPLTGHCCFDPSGHIRLVDAKGKPGRLCPPSLQGTASGQCDLSGMTHEMVCCFDVAGVPRYRMNGPNGPIDTKQACDTSGYVMVGNLQCPADNRIPDQPTQTQCSDEPAPCCSGPDGLYTQDSVLYREQERTVHDRVPLVRIDNGRKVIVHDENGDIVYVDGPPHQVTEHAYQTCKPTCAGTRDVGACACDEVRCCEDEENGDLYAEYGMPDGKATVLFEQTTDPVTGRVSRVIPNRCPSACPGSVKNIGYCARTCEHPIISDTPRPPKKPDDEPDKQKTEPVISCDECPMDPDAASTTLCDPCPPPVDLGLAGDELARYCSQLPEALLAEPKLFAEQVKQQIQTIDAGIQAATQVPRATLDKVQKMLLDGLGASGFDSLSLPGAPPNLCDSTDPSYAKCLSDYMAKVDAFIAHPPGGVTLPPDGLKAWSLFKKAATPLLGDLDKAQQQLTAAISAAQAGGLNITTQYDDFINRALARLGKQPLGTLCAGISADALSDCIDDALDSAQQELERLAKACRPDTSKSESCAPRLCRGEAAQRAKQQLDDLETLPGDGLGWNEFPKDACCTALTADFNVNSKPKKWEGGQFFQRSTRLGTWGWGWSARAGRNLWVALWKDPNDPPDVGDKVDTGAWAYMAAGLQVQVPKPPYLSSLRVPYHPACLLDPSSQACADAMTHAFPELRFGQRSWLATAGGVGNVRLTYAPKPGFRYDWHVRTEVKVLEEVVWEFARGDAGQLDIPDVNDEWELFDEELVSWSYTVFTPIPFFVDAGAYARAVAYARFGLSRTAIGLGAEIGVGGGITAYLEGGIGVSLLGGRLRIGAGVDAMLVVLKVRAGARVEGGVQQLPPTKPDRKVVLAGYCFSVPYDMRMFDGDVNVFAEFRLKFGFIKVTKRWTKRLFKWEGVGLGGKLWERCETKCYTYEGTPDPQVLPPNDALTPPDALPGPDRPPCWPNYKYSSVTSFVLACQNALEAKGLAITDMCLGQAPRPPECADFPCGPFANIGDLATSVSTAITNDIDRASRTWHSTLSAYAAFFPLPGLPAPTCTPSVDTTYFNCLKAYMDNVRTSPAYASWCAANQATLNNLAALESQWNSSYSKYQTYLSEAKGDFGRLKDVVDNLASSDPCTCDYSLSELGTRGSSLQYKCGGQMCGSQKCGDPCPKPYPDGPGYPDPKRAPPFGPEWRACCPSFAPDCATK